MVKSSAKISKETADFLLEKAQLMLDMRNWHTARGSKDDAVLFYAVKHIEDLLRQSYMPTTFDVFTGKLSFVDQEVL